MGGGAQKGRATAAVVVSSFLSLGGTPPFVVFAAAARCVGGRQCAAHNTRALAAESALKGRCWSSTSTSTTNTFLSKRFQQRARGYYERHIAFLRHNAPPPRRPRREGFLRDSKKKTPPPPPSRVLFELRRPSSSRRFRRLFVCRRRPKHTQTHTRGRLKRVRV